jgi:hypothetical protein
MKKIMSSKEIVQTLMDALQKGDFEKAKSWLADGFQFSGPIPKPISAEAWLEMSMNLKRAFPNLEYHFRVEGVSGSDVVKVSSELKGTHKGDLDLADMNMGVIPATNKSFAIARQHGQVTVKADKVASWAMEPTKGAGLMAILEKLDVKLPAM